MAKNKGNSQDRDQYLEKSPFVRLFGTPGRTKIFDVFLRKHYKDLSAAEVSRLADIHPSTFNRNIENLIDAGIVVRTRDVGGTQLYKLNKSNPVVKIFAKARSEVLDHLDSVPEIDSEPLSDEDFVEGDFKIQMPDPGGAAKVNEGIRSQMKNQLEMED